MSERETLTLSPESTEKVEQEVVQDSTQEETVEPDQTEGEEEPKVVKKLSWEEKKQRMKEVYRTLGGDDRTAWDQGWRPEEFYAGKNKDGSDRPFIDAREFLDNARDSLPIANERIKSISKEKDEEIGDLKKQIKQLVEYNKIKEEREMSSSVSSLEKQRDEAILDGDIDMVKEIEKRQKKVQDSRFDFDSKSDVANDVTPKPQAPVLPKEEQQAISEWESDNDWYHNNNMLRNYAHGMIDDINEQNPHLPIRDKLNIITEEIELRFSDKIKKKSAPRSMATGNNSSFGNTEKTSAYNDLPQEAKVACDKMVTEGRLTRKKYVELYYK